RRVRRPLGGGGFTSRGGRLLGGRGGGPAVTATCGDDEGQHRQPPDHSESSHFPPPSRLVIRTSVLLSDSTRSSPTSCFLPASGPSVARGAHAPRRGCPGRASPAFRRSSPRRTPRAAGPWTDAAPSAPAGAR